MRFLPRLRRYRKETGRKTSLALARWTPLLLAAGMLCAPEAAGQQRPLRIDDPELLPVGRMRAEFGIEFLQGQRFSLSGLEGDLTRLGVVGVHIGVGEYAEFQVSGVVRDILAVTRRTAAIIPPDFSGNATSDVGDFVLGTKLRLLAEKDGRPGVGFRFAVQLPNASNESGLGNDELAFHTSVLLSKNVGRARLLGSLGLSILGSPVTPNSQSDLFTYGVAAIVPVHPKIRLVAEATGRQGPQRVGNESLAQVRIGTQIYAAGLRWDVAAIAGLREFDPNAGIALGVTFEFQGFRRNKGPVTIK